MLFSRRCSIAVVTAATLVLAAAVSERATELRNLGLAQLENEKPADAVETFTALTEEAPDEPLGWANLAVAHLRSQQVDEATAAIDRALELAPGDAKILAIRGDIEQWRGAHDEALVTLLAAARTAPDDVEIQYALYRLASTLETEEAARAVDLALENLTRLRPDNIVVMLHRGQRAVARGDRASATRSYLRVGELLWQAPPIAERALAMLTEALESGEPGAARTPAQRVNNVLVVTPMYQQGLRELAIGIQGVPIERFSEEAPPSRFGTPAAVRFAGATVAESAVVGGSIVAGDFDGDQRPDLAWLARNGEGPATLTVSLSTTHAVASRGEAPGAERLLAADLDNDAALDLLAYGPETAVLFQGQPGGAFQPATEAFGLAGAGGTAAAVLDFDIEGDLDLIVAGGR
ncbi:MAG: FG-GAP-like repeat-containing protein, partial [Thermoanaerobaculia bacterium]|nr:FG-GAP-like repeat-containing protein [Thermoanaerobaculia bacterium]